MPVYLKKYIYLPKYSVRWVMLYCYGYFRSLPMHNAYKAPCWKPLPANQ